jgi:hypothetical protein
MPFTYERLTQKHPTYDGTRMAQVEELYEGGWAIMRKAPSYLGQMPLEHEELYKVRCGTTAYQPYFGQILDQFVSELFTQPLSIQPAGDADNPNTPGEVPDEDFYSALASDIDGEGTTLEDLAADMTTTALKHRVAYIMVDAPDAPDGTEPANLAEEDALGARRCYAYEVPPQQVIDWKLDKSTGLFAWVILATKEQERQTPDGSRDIIREQFTIWTIESGGKAQWARFAIEYKPEEPPRNDQIVPQLPGKLGAGTTSFDRIPLLCFELPKGLWVGNKIGPQALEHWRRRSSLVGAEARSCVAIPFVTQGPELPAIGESTSEAADNPHRGRDPMGQFRKQGFLLLGHQDQLAFAEPTGASYEIIDKQIDAVRESMFSVNHQMAASVRPTGQALGRSGLSKQKDEDKTAKILGALGRLVRQFFILLYDTISRGRGEDVVWVAHGLDSYEHDDREQVLEESLEIGMVGIPSPTFRKEHCKRLVKKLVPNLPPETVAQIFDEIDSGVDAEQELRDVQQEAAQDAIENPLDPLVQARASAGKAPPKPGVPKPGAKPPKKAAA